MVRRYQEMVEVQSRPDLRTVGFSGLAEFSESVESAEAVEPAESSQRPQLPVPAGDTGTAGPSGSAGSARRAASARPVVEAPTAFVWRGRLYVVREVLDHWRERQAWWRGVLDPTRAEGGTAGTVPGPDELEHEVWRVVASAGRDRGSGVYDLAGGGRPDHAWRLVRVAD